MTLRATRFDTPLGPAAAYLDGRGALVRLQLVPPGADLGHEGGEEVREDPGGAGTVRAQVAAYFAGERRAFELALAPRGTAFQRRVWDALLELPYGATATYADVARRLGRPGAARAVGRANSRNPIWIVVPCHRVIGANGSLTGYAGGLDVKRALLELEGALPPARPGRAR